MRLLRDHQLPTSKQAQAFWISQQEGWDCWLATLRMALRFWGYDFDYRQLLDPLLGTPLRISEKHGGFFPYLALIAFRLGFNGWLRCSLKDLWEFVEVGYLDTSGPRIKLENLALSLLLDIVSQCKQNNSPRSYLYESLILLRETKFSSQTHFFTAPNRPSLRDILLFLRLRLPVIVYVGCEEFYQLPNDDSGHLLTFVPVSDVERGYVVLDAYRERGYRFFSKWKQHLDAADKYDWTRWSNWLLAVGEPSMMSPSGLFDSDPACFG